MYYKNKRGFTLIELLVVVLIIGILAAIAVPQYQKAVDRARATEVVQLIASLQRATETWILANPGVVGVYDLLGENTSHSLDIDLPCQYDEYDVCYIKNASLAIDINNNDSTSVYSYYFYDRLNEQYVVIAALRDADGKWTHKCGYFDNRGKAICEGLQGYEVEENFEV